MAYFYSPLRKQYESLQNIDCPFCDNDVTEKQIIRRNDGTDFANAHYYWVVNAFPSFEGHTMLVPKRHLNHLHEETKEEIISRNELLQEAISILQSKYPNCGIEHFIQTGPGSNGSVAHLHWHLLPASPEDALRGFEKLGHFNTTKPNEEKIIIFPQNIKMNPDELLTFLSQT